MKKSTISKSAYLNTSIISEFIDYLHEIVTDQVPLDLTFSVPKQNKEYPSEYWFDNPQRIVNYKFFKESLTEYYWARESFDQNKERLQKISSQFKDAIASSSDDAFYQAVDDCLLWGAGYRKSASLYKNNIDWLNKHFPTKEGVLSYFVDTLNLLQAEQVELHSLPSIFKMNSGYTKVYALMAPSHFIIYDSRVAAGLGLLFIKFVSDKAVHLHGSKNALGIRFLKQGTKPRDPNFILNIGMEAIYPSSPKSSVHHAESNILTNWLLQAVEERVKQCAVQSNVDLRKMEAGLFMLGSQVGRPNGPLLA